MPTKANGSKGNRAPESVSRTSSLTVFSPVVKDGVSEIATKLVEIDDVIASLDAKLSPQATPVPDIGELFQEIVQLHKDVRGIKYAHDTQLQELRDEMKDKTKTEIVELTRDKVKSVIADTITAQVTEEMRQWGKRPGVTGFVGELQSMLKENDKVIKEAHIQLENSRSRHANSTLEIQIDFNTGLQPIKRLDGYISELFPKSLRELFSYDSEQILQLIKEHGLRPLDKHSENLNRFLLFIGLNASVPEQSLDFSEQLPAYPLGDTAGTRDERSQKGVRRASSGSQDAAKQNTSWYNRWPAI